MMSIENNKPVITIGFGFTGTDETNFWENDFSSTHTTVEIESISEESFSESPRDPKTVTTMELCETNTIWTPAPKKTVKKPVKKVLTYKQSLTLDEYHKECERKRLELTNPIKTTNTEKRPTNTDKRQSKPTKHERTSKKSKGWETVEKTSVTKDDNKSSLKTPQGWTKNIPVKVTKDKNTTLILKNLPYENVSEKDLKRFFVRYAGPVKFVNVLKKEDNTCKGLAFVRFENKKGSDKGLTLDKFFYDGRRVYVEYAKSR